MSNCFQHPDEKVVGEVCGEGFCVKCSQEFQAEVLTWPEPKNFKLEATFDGHGMRWEKS